MKLKKPERTMLAIILLLSLSMVSCAELIIAEFIDYDIIVKRKHLKLGMPIKTVNRKFYRTTVPFENEKKKLNKSYKEKIGDYFVYHYHVANKIKVGAVMYQICFKDGLLVAIGKKNCQILLEKPTVVAIKAKPKKQIFPEETKIAAKDFENHLSAEAPMSKSFINSIDTNRTDGHLIVEMKESLFNMEKAEQNSVYEIILTLWQGTEYVIEKGYGNWVTIKYWDFNNSKEIKWDIH